MKRLGALAVATAILAIAPLASAHTNATVVQVKGGEFFFKLSTKTITKLTAVRCFAARHAPYWPC